MGGYISAFSETLALAVVVSKGIPPLGHALEKETEDHIKAAAACSLGQIGRHSADHAKAVADCNILPKLLDVYLHQDSSDDLKTKAKREFVANRGLATVQKIKPEPGSKLAEYIQTINNCYPARDCSVLLARLRRDVP